MKNHTKFWIIFSFIMLFVLGVIGGILLDRYLLQPESVLPPPPRSRSSVRFPSLEIMARELGLTPEQKNRIRSVFQDNDQRLRALHQEVIQQLRKIRGDLKEEIKTILNKEQAAKFEAMIQKYIKQRKKEWERRRKHPSAKTNSEGVSR